ncbi:MAG: PQQ-binding-like beta-propeller repeat protein [Pseudomonadota bacterium]
MHKQQSNGLIRGIIAVSALALVLTSCGRREEILSGERETIRPEQELLEEFDNLPSVRVTEPRLNENWSHRNGNSAHSIRHPAFTGPATRVWSLDIGKGNSRRTRLTAEPIIVGERIFVMDAIGMVSAVSTSGQLLWQADLRPERDAKDDISGGGIAFGDGRLFVTTGYGDLVALDPTNGSEFWRQRFQAGLTAAPVVSGKTVIAVSVGNEALGLNTQNGRIRWRQVSGGSNTAVAGGGTPAISGRIAIIAYPSGEVSALTVTQGIRVWSSAVTGSRLGLARGIFAPISGDPVVSGNTLYAANQSGQLASISLRSGDRIWTANEGSYSPVWVTDNSVFIVTDQARLKRLNRSTGGVLWSQDLPDKPNRRRVRSVYAHFGPVLAGGVLYVASSDGQMRSFNANNGAPIGVVDLGGGAATHMAFAAGRMYIVTDNGQLVAFQ